MSKIIIIGGTSGIGRELCKVFSHYGNEVGITGRREHLLTEIAKELPNKSYIRKIDVTSIDEAMFQLESLICDMNGVDIIIISAGIGYLNSELEWSKEQQTIDTNVSGFTAMCNVAMKYFAKQGKGHLVGISSIAAIRGNSSAPAYAASKAFISNYLEGLRLWTNAKELPIAITEIQPGFVDTAMAQGNGLFWMASPNKAAKQIYQAIVNQQTHAYITKRWRLIAWLLKIAPNFIMNNLAKK